MAGFRSGRKRDETYQKVVREASKLFHQNGYSETSLNEILRGAGVSKSSFYSMFSSKEEIGMEYLTRRKDSSLEVIKTMIHRKKGGEARIIALFDYAKTLLTGNTFTGCPFTNMYLKSNKDSLSPEMLGVMQSYKNTLKGYIRDATEAYIDEKGGWTGQRNVHMHTMATAIYVLYEGGIVASTIYQDTEHLDAAMDAAVEMLSNYHK